MRGLVVVLALLALLGGCGGEEEAAAPAEPRGTAPPRETTPRADEPKRPAAPEIAGVDLDGNTLSLASFRGRAVLVNVWSSW
jgi:hypothetical protein